MLLTSWELYKHVAEGHLYEYLQLCLLLFDIIAAEFRERIQGLNMEGGGVRNESPRLSFKVYPLERVRRPPTVQDEDLLRCHLLPGYICCLPFFKLKYSPFTELC